MAVAAHCVTRWRASGGGRPTLISRLRGGPFWARARRATLPPLTEHLTITHASACAVLVAASGAPAAAAFTHAVSSLDEVVHTGAEPPEKPSFRMA